MLSSFADRLSNTLFGLFAICGALACCAAPQKERFVTKGVNPAFSPDGRSIAFQRLEDGEFHLGVASVGGGQVEWIEKGPGMAAYPVWTPSGGLLYTYGHDSETARQAWITKSQNGYGLRLWENGKKRDITRGRCRDFTPCVSPDGKTAYFASTRWVVEESKNYSIATSTDIGKVALSGCEPERVVCSPGGNNTGFIQPAISPDGQKLVWGHLENFFGNWRIYGTKIGKLDRTEWCMVSPPGINALAPRWHPNGRLVCFTGFRKGDPGWGVWVEDVTNGKVRRITTGENPVFSPDGKWLAYDRDRKVYVRPFGQEDEPDEETPEASRDDLEHEKILWSIENVPKELSLTMEGASKFAFGSDRTFFLRVKAKLDGTIGLRQLLIGEYKEHELGFQAIADRTIWFSSRFLNGNFAGVNSKAYKGGGEYTITGIRTARRLLVSVNGNVPTSLPADMISLNNLRRFVVGRGLKAGEAVIKAEVGTGWPNNVPKFRRREDLFK